MTHEELLAEIIGEGDGEIVKSTRRWNNTKALRSVVELHKPIQDKKLWCEGCRVEDDDWYSTEYPCPTIQAIQEQLK